MRELPILFSAPMVRAILERRKTQTRRVVKGAPTGADSYVLGVHQGTWGIHEHVDALEASRTRCPYGTPGDRLWVKEAHALESCVDGNEPPFSDGRPTRRAADDDFDGGEPAWTQAHYRATDPAPDLCCERENCAQCRDHDMGPHWRPSIHMPRWASRITLEVTGVRVERLRAISEADAIAEGAEPFRLPVHPNREQLRHVDGFKRLWESINGAGSWHANPWVWVVEFRSMDLEGRPA